MRKYLYIVGLGIALAISAGVQAAEKIATVNIPNIFQQLPERDAVAKKLEEEFKSRATELQTVERDLKDKIQKFQRDSSTMKADVRTKTEKDLMVQREDFAKKAQTFEQDNRRRQMEERDKLLNVIQEAVSKVAKRDNYSIVIDANSVPYADPANDITQKVLTQVKK